MISSGSVITELNEDASRCLEDPIHHLPGTPLQRSFSGLGMPVQMRVDKHEQYSHIDSMKSITIQTTLPAPAASVWATAQQPQTFIHVAGAMLRYPAAEDHPGPWQVGDKTVGWTFLFRFIPFSRHTIEVVSIDHASMTLLTEEFGGLVRTWRHYVIVEALDEDSCRYTDRLDIEAGILTAAVAGFARVFYRYRQRRWRRLAARLQTSSGPASIEKVSARPSTQHPTEAV